MLMAARKGHPAHEEVDAEIVEDAPRPSAPVPLRAEGPVLEGEVVPGPKVRKPRKAKAKAVPEAVAPAEPEDSEAEDTAGEPEPIDVEPAVEALEEVESELPVVVARSTDTGLARHDPLKAYMNEVTRHPLLTREEEVSLARHFRATGDVKAAYRLVASNLRLVVKLAHEYHRNPLALLDLVQEGNIGLMQAVRKFDPERGVKLSSYAAWWIRAYILRYIMDNWKMVKLGTTEAQRKLFFKLRQEQEKLAAQGVEVTPKLLAERLNVTEQDVVEMDQRLGQDELSLSAPMSNDEDSQTRGDRLAAGGVPVDDALGSAQLKGLFREKLAEFALGLSDKERFIFEKRLTSEEPLTLQDIGAKWGVSRERARQIEAALVARMKVYMQEHIPDFALHAQEED